MKRLFLIVSFAFLFLLTWAQTNFRSISLPEAIEAAKVEKKLVFIDFYTSWCGPCKMMATNVFPQPKVGEYFNAKFVCLKLDAEKEGKELAARFKVRAYPTFIVLDTNEKVLLNKVGGNFDGDKFVEEIEQGLNPELSPDRLEERYTFGERTPELIKVYAALKLKDAHTQRMVDQTKLDEVSRMVNDYFNGLTDEQRLAADNVFLYAADYTPSVLDGKAAYMVANRNRFAPQVKEVITGYITNLYAKEVQRYMTCQIPYEEAAYVQLKKQVNELGLNKEQKYDIPFLLIETHAKGNLNDYLAVCETEVKNMSKDLKSALLTNFNQTVKTEDVEVLKRAVRFIRSQLPDLDVNTIYFVLAPLVILERAIPA